MEPEEKSKQIDDLLTDISGKHRPDVIKSGTCAMCETPNMNFREEIDRREYQISGMCQDCQDVAFADPEDDD